MWMKTILLFLFYSYACCERLYNKFYFIIFIMSKVFFRGFLSSSFVGMSITNENMPCVTKTLMRVVTVKRALEIRKASGQPVIASGVCRLD